MALKKKKKVLLYYNPYSGNGSFLDKIDYVIEQFQKNDLQIVPVRTNRGKAIEEALAEMDQDEYRQILVSGGDGTVNLLVNAMVKYDIHLPIGLLPSGTANDFAFNFDIPSDIEEQVDIALNGTECMVDVGRVNQKCFINVAAMGALVDVSQKTDPELKNNIGVLAYYLKGASEIPNLKAIPMKFIEDDNVFEEKIYFMVVLNGQSAGGFRNICPDAAVNDGLLDVVIFKKMSIIDLPKLFIKVLKGRQSKDKNVIMFRTNHIRLESPNDVSTDIDGETGEKFPLDISILKGRLKVFSAKDSECAKSQEMYEAKKEQIQREIAQGIEDSKTESE